eukprot:TRINITY_DN105354_c0_g1_i1.p3 TRINITY_DN105354_c0_g1~~TRINITY_DN105354_c0_g1_i1.p3  ORF type:complete len:101 (-),score=16.54 TRINITY_DN105354_c0_g1_i1:79-381(-)
MQVCTVASWGYRMPDMGEDALLWESDLPGCHHLADCKVVTSRQKGKLAWLWTAEAPGCQKQAARRATVFRREDGMTEVVSNCKAPGVGHVVSMRETHVLQ